MKHTCENEGGCSLMLFICIYFCSLEYKKRAVSLARSIGPFATSNRVVSESLSCWMCAQGKLPCFFFLLYLKKNYYASMVSERLEERKKREKANLLNKGNESAFNAFGLDFRKSLRESDGCWRAHDITGLSEITACLNCLTVVILVVLFRKTFWRQGTGHGRSKRYNSVVSSHMHTEIYFLRFHSVKNEESFFFRE